MSTAERGKTVRYANNGQGARSHYSLQVLNLPKL
jgi:hypothetical protein